MTPVGSNSAPEPPPEGGGSAEPYLELRGVDKRFGGVHALREIDLTITRGSIHALVGENGAGKSTLGRIIAGALGADAGTMRLEGRTVRYRSPREALADGIALIAQELSLVPELTVMQNVLLGSERGHFGWLDERAMRRRFAELDRFGFGLPADAPVGSLRAADQQKVEILRAVARRVRLIVMDEPTTSLTPDEASRLFDVMREQARHGTAIIFISHALESVLALADTLTVLRDGRVVRTGPAAQETVETLVKAMIGRSLDAIFPARVPPPSDSPVVLSVRGLGTAGWVRDVSFDVRRGEIVGLAGLIGSGRSEVAHALSGAARLDAGSLELEGRPLHIRTPRDAVRRGIALLPESRKAQGLVLDGSVLDNITLPHLNEFQRAGVVSQSRQEKRVTELADQVGLKAPSLKAPVASLSGGNQQKVMFAKWLCNPLRVLVADEPTRGVDIGAKQAIYELLVGLAGKGLAVVLISSELEEVL
ncbi:MAG: sugar ABC transporter ATP-binding protein, partial [Solirubrobacterales bacterium]|nr:sugar ABC transporter ATP-binding protein [Solirubrobacterales bacterium]